MCKESTLDYFVGESGNLYKRKTDYANRRWWFVFVAHKDGKDEWRIHDGMPSETIRARSESRKFQAKAP